MLRYLIILIGWLVSIVWLQGQTTAYSRAVDLAETEARIQRMTALMRGTSPENQIRNYRVSEILQADNRFLDYLRRTGNISELIAGTVTIEKLRQDDLSNAYILSVSSSVRMLVDRGASDPEAVGIIERFGSNVLSQLPSASLGVAGEAMMMMSPPFSRGSPNRPIALDYLPRENALEGLLGLANRVDGFLINPKTNAYIGMTGSEQYAFERAAIPRTFGGVAMTELESNLHYGALREFVQTHRIFGEPPPSHTGHPSMGWQKKFEDSIARILKQRYSDTPTDLDEVQQAIEKHLTASALKERIILAAYIGTNPFAGRKLSSLTNTSTHPIVATVVAPLKTNTATSANNVPALEKSTHPIPMIAVAVPESSGQKPTTNSTPSYIPLAAVFAAGVVLWWFLTRSRPR